MLLLVLQVLKICVESMMSFTMRTFVLHVLEIYVERIQGVGLHQ